MARVFVLGIAVLDHVFHVREMPRRNVKYRARRYEAAIGGNSATAAVTIARLGGEPVLATRLGDDPNSVQILAGLSGAGVDTTYCRQTPGAVAGVSAVFVDAAGERQIVNHRGTGYDDSIDWLNAACLRGCGSTLVDTRWPSAAARVMALAGELGLPGVLDAEPPFDDVLNVLRDASHIALPAEGLRILTGDQGLRDGLLATWNRFGGWVAVTDGEHGAYFTSDGTIDHRPAHHVKVVDSLGAGDVWHGAFALALAEGRDEAAAVVFANTAAALKCANGTGWPSIPTRGDVDNALAS